MFTADDVLRLLPSLATTRPIFHSEADFQHALAWAVQQAAPTLGVRLETRPARGTHLDILITDSTDGARLAVELKYPTRRWDDVMLGEEYHLAEHGAQDLTGYDFVKDITRLEQCVAAGYATAGLALLLTNDSLFWRTPSHTRVTNGDSFRIHEGVRLSGSRAWGPLTGTGTTGTTRQQPLELRGEYPLSWRTYAHFDDGTDFRYCAVRVYPET